MNVVTKVIQSIDHFQREHKFVGFPLAVIKKYGDDQAGHQAALITYYGFLAIFPLLLVLTSVLRLLIHNNDALRRTIIEKATSYFPIVGSELQHNVQSLHGTGIMLAVGVILTLYGTRGVADAIRGAINHVWQIPYMRRSGFPRNILKSLVSILIGGTGLIVAPFIYGYVTSLGGQHWFIRAAGILAMLFILYVVFLVLVKLALPTKVPVGDLRPAAVIATVGLAILQLVGVSLLKHQVHHLNSLYGTFAIVLGLLYWLYLQAQVLMYAIETASVRALKLWPRALDQSHLTPQDRRAFQLYARRNRFHASEEIEVISLDRPDQR